MTKGLLISARRKNDISKLVKKHPNNVTLRAYFIKYRNNFTSILRVRKILFYKSKFSSAITNPKLTWKLINNLTGTKNNSNNETFNNNIENNGQTFNPHKDPSNIANIFNSFFISVGKDLAVNFNNSLLNYDVKVPSLSFNQLFLKKIEKTEVLNIIKNFKDKTAAGFDKISVKLLKHIAPYIVDQCFPKWAISPPWGR